ncbi:hypothetical protein FGO68_gene14603 [Halteria grandinella]|uniref:EF-hand domain-containing protein n=1 Tax=Halteria grandinella TaxID=5974 RepID=A0A8J8NIB5_HALGN|nr:hypothetical protein FGO68_gene14603 [Halteria grandinella]
MEAGQGSPGSAGFFFDGRKGNSQWPDQLEEWPFDFDESGFIQIVCPFEIICPFEIEILFERFDADGDHLLRFEQLNRIGWLSRFRGTNSTFVEKGDIEPQRTSRQTEMADRRFVFDQRLATRPHDDRVTRFGLRFFLAHRAERMSSPPGSQTVLCFKRNLSTHSGRSRQDQCHPCLQSVHETGLDSQLNPTSKVKITRQLCA